ncbi:MAG TPA: Zn-ribbon domain-containing OB-fold protein [Nocardioidaceae bacterium]|nr:Zn-ribbon domain-containing OB-fold protein [Nocardioidaceae bacterium]
MTATDQGPVTGIVTPVRLDYTYAASAEESRFLRGLAEGKIRGQRCPVCEKVYAPPRGACPVDGVPTRDEVELPDRGIVTTFCIVNVPFLGQRITPPYVSAYILLDGADIPFLHLVLGCEASEVRMGMRVEAVWKPREEWTTSMENIDHFRPTGEPDAAYESFAAHL